MSTTNTPPAIKLSERNHVEKPLLDQLAGLGWAGLGWAGRLST
jgi:type I restriction enzyme R subunit